MDAFDRAVKVAAGYVSGRMYTCKELEDKLVRKKFDREIAERVVSEYVAAGILDDREYARLYVSEAIRLCGKGMYRIKQELFRKGVASSIIDEVCKETDEDTYEALCEYVDARGLFDNVTSRRELEKLKARLVRRGFSLSEIRRCVDEHEIHFTDESEYI